VVQPTLYYLDEKWISLNTEVLNSKNSLPVRMRKYITHALEASLFIWKLNACYNVFDLTTQNVELITDRGPQTCNAPICNVCVWPTFRYYDVAAHFKWLAPLLHRSIANPSSQYHFQNHFRESFQLQLHFVFRSNILVLISQVFPI
jgi:hypothetical protein